MDLLFVCTEVGTGTQPCAGTQSALPLQCQPSRCHITAVTAQHPPDTSWEFLLPSDPSPSLAGTAPGRDCGIITARV